MIQTADLLKALATDGVDSFVQLLDDSKLQGGNIDLTELLFKAIEQQKLPCIEALIAVGVDPSKPCKIYPNRTPLMVAAYLGFIEVVEYLIEHGAETSINCRNKYGNTALMLAAIKGDARIVQKLLAGGADATMVGAGGQTAILNATGFGHPQIVENLIAAGADPKEAEVTPISQGVILHKFTKYINLQAKRFPAQYNPEDAAKIAAEIHDGQCSGFRALWLWHKKHKTESVFFAKLKKVSTWDEKELSQELQDDFDPLINEVFWLQQQQQQQGAGFSLADAGQQDLDKLFAVIAEQKLQHEFNFAFVLRKEEISSLMKQILFVDKMLSIGCNGHVVAVMQCNDKYELYDPNNVDGVQIFNNIEDLTAALIISLTENSENINLWVDIFDIAGAKIPRYPDPKALIHELITTRRQQERSIPMVNSDPDVISAMDFLLSSRNLANIQAAIDAEHLDTTAILSALQHNMKKVVPTLIAQGADVNAADSNGLTPLLLAIKLKDLTLIKTLAQAGADLNLANKINGSTPLMKAIFGQTPITNLVELGADVNKKNPTNGQSPLWFAIVLKNYDAAQILIANGANVEEQYLEYYLSAIINDGCYDLAKALIVAGINPNCTNLPLEGQQPLSPPLILAIQKKQGDLTFLLAERANLDITDFTGTTALMYALMHNLFELAEVLIARGANVHAENKEGMSALLIAKNKDQKAIIEKLLTAGAKDKENHGISWQQQNSVQKSNPGPDIKIESEPGHIIQQKKND